MEENKKNKISLLTVILVIIMLVLAVVIIFMYMRNEKLNKEILDNQEYNTVTKMENNSQEKIDEAYTNVLNDRENKIKELEAEINNLKNAEKTDLEIVEQALLEKLETADQTSVNLTEHNTYKVENVYINKIEIYTEDYLKKEYQYSSEHIKEILNNGAFVGTVSYTITFNKDLDNVLAEGSGGELEGNKLIESRYFILTKTGDNYKVELCTGL